jgi:hypothetical protein
MCRSFAVAGRVRTSCVERKQRPACCDHPPGVGNSLEPTTGRDRKPAKFLVPQLKVRELRFTRVTRWPEIVVCSLTTRSKRMRRHFASSVTSERATGAINANLSRCAGDRAWM